MRVSFTMSWTEMQEKLRDDQAFHDLTICEIITVFTGSEAFYNNEFAMRLTDTQDDLIVLSFTKK